MIRLKYHFKEYPKSTLSVFLKTQVQIDAYKQKHQDYVYISEEKLQ